LQISKINNKLYDENSSKISNIVFANQCLTKKELSMDTNIFEQNVLNAQTKLAQIVEFIKTNSNNLEAHQMESKLFEQLQSLGVELMDVYFKSVENNDVGESIQNEAGIELKRHGRKTSNYFSIFGNVAVNRTIYWKKGHDLVVPLAEQCNLPKSSYSYLVQDMLNSLSVNTPFSESKNYYKKFFNHTIHVRQIEEMTSFVTEDYDAFYKEKSIPDSSLEGGIQVLSFDGKGVPMIKKEAAKIKARLNKGEKRQKKKEALVGVSYTIDKNIRTAASIAKNLVYPTDKEDDTELNEKNRACNIRRMASVARAKPDVMEEILQDAIRRNTEQKRETVILIDGMPYLQKQVETQINNRISYCLILDIIHACEYIWLCGNTLYGEKTKECKAFVYKQLKKILEGKVGRVIGGIKQIKTKQEIKGNKAETIEKVIKYLTNHKSLMKYDQYLSKGYPVGTGVVESACKQVVKQRMEGSGMRWSIDGAENMLLMRSIKTSNDWDSFQKFHTVKQKSKLYENYTPLKKAA